MWFIGVEVQQDTSAPPPKKNLGSAPGSPYNVVSSLAAKQIARFFVRFIAH